MKKITIILVLILIINIIQSASFATELIDNDVNAHNDKISFNKPAPIVDELLQSDGFKNVMPVYMKTKESIKDEFIESYEQSDALIKLRVRKNGEYKKVVIDDELVNPKFKDKCGSISILKKHHGIKIEDNFAKNNIDLRNMTITKAKNCYDFTKAQIPVQLKLIKNITTKNSIFEGDSVLFKTVEDVVVNGIRLPKGTKIVGRIETISKADKMGSPANIVIDNLYVKNNPEICFYGAISKTGANRAIWVYPLYQAGNFIFYVTGYVFVPIHGGHAKLSTNETYTVFYETH